MFKRVSHTQVFKKRVRNVRARRSSDRDNSDEEVGALEETRERQRLRKRSSGVSASTLAAGQKLTVERESMSNGPFKVKAGGMVYMATLRSGQVKQVDACDTGIGTQFSAETNTRDEDEEMTKYIEAKLSQWKGEKSKSEETDMVFLSPEEAALRSLPEHYRTSSTCPSEEMLSSQMLSGIPEVELGIDAKIKNIEATEEAKLKYLWDRRNQKVAPSHFVLTNVAANFVQDDRFNLNGAPKRRKPVDWYQPSMLKPRALDAGEEKVWKKVQGESATDDYHYEKFKKRFRRH